VQTGSQCCGLLRWLNISFLSAPTPTDTKTTTSHTIVLALPTPKMPLFMYLQLPPLLSSPTQQSISQAQRLLTTPSNICCSSIRSGSALHVIPSSLFQDLTAIQPLLRSLHLSTSSPFLPSRCASATSATWHMTSNPKHTSTIPS
jgi:hypothetical protein